jgi:hypothetical protein
MSKLAGLCLVVLGGGLAYTGYQEVQAPTYLTSYAAYSSVILGGLLMLAGIGHFLAPHKSFLLSVPLLLVFQVHMYCVALFYDVKKIGVFLGGFLVASFLIMIISYLGYRRHGSQAS